MKRFGVILTFCSIPFMILGFTRDGAFLLLAIALDVVGFTLANCAQA